VVSLPVDAFATRLLAQALSGPDFLIGRGGEDELYGGRGDDSLEGNVGDDYLNGGKVRTYSMEASATIS
jgi:Ca2+-binding RTX toxin-like protein